MNFSTPPGSSVTFADGFFIFLSKNVLLIPLSRLTVRRTEILSNIFAQTEKFSPVGKCKDDTKNCP